jgi:hypothetical protein
VSVPDKIVFLLRHAALAGENVSGTKCSMEDIENHIQISFIIFSLNLNTVHEIKEDEAGRTRSTHDKYTQKFVGKLHFKRKTGEPGSKLKVKIKTISLLEK